MLPIRHRIWLAIRALSITSLLLLAAVSSHAQEGTGSLVGQIKPTHDHDFVLATARIPDLALRTEVAADGSFRFEGLRPGAYMVEVRVPSLGVVAERVEIQPGLETSVELELTAGSHSEEIVVSASAIASDPTELATPTTSLSGQELALRLASSLGETLSSEPGISSTFFGPGASRPIIRGMAGDRVRMLEGGLGTGDASAVSADHAVTADPGTAERIEVVRGPATLLYGSSAIGGVVNVIDERIPSTRATGGVHGSVELRGATVDDEKAATLNLDGGNGNWAWHLDASSRESEDYEIPGFARIEEDEEEHEEGEEEENPFGTVPNTSIETQGARIGATYFFGDRGFFGLSVGGFDTDYGLPGGLGHHEEEGEGEGEGHGEEEEEEEIVRIDMEQRRLDLRGQINQPFAGFDALRLRVGNTDYEHVELEGDEIGTFFFNDALEARLELVQEAKTRGRSTHLGSFGLQIFDRDLEAVGAEAFLPKTATQRWAVFTLQELEMGPIRWQVGGRFESQDVDPDSATFSSRSSDGLSGSLGLVWETSDRVSFAASAARSVKLPAAEELFSDGLHVATQTFEVGDPNLTEETGLGIDLSVRFKGERVSGELTFFQQDFDDFIFQAFTGDEVEESPVVLYSQEDATFQGFEAKARVELYDRNGRHLHLNLMGDQVDAELDRGGNLPRIPPMRFGSGLHFHSEQWNASAEVLWTDDQTDIAANETVTEGSTRLNASLGYRVLLKRQIVDFLLRGRNLTDEEARSHTSFLKTVAPLPGRNITLSAKLRF